MRSGTLEDGLPHLKAKRKSKDRLIDDEDDEAIFLPKAIDMPEKRS